ncbi:deoxynucleoside monophosphate kinase [Streptomyces phage Emma1919]|uniref:Deoxynucleoside monophosphate kinase n=2 Tax=Gilsonvirus gilson TaxID=2846398 RepID=A0A3Q9R4T7_9CAUD|nr:deoxynucleoside monophosphate kinase [Streptomyces phage Gilson]QQV92450.1 deoxynucleoside monophosphate kinase [Streptomyces phage MeganTheeKilla]QZE11222.1 deoxynucleoside monophosphate kinase [Streptomyces phage Forrest]QZE11449.1 deoxynucleoside monophosphate kinase [Streptomyces phage Jada]URQ04697.1 deoxynucleoside monophosphate kinase [Streptomyces phage Emma1919]AZU97161.1 deoxynucleoside monophosphate kinase [Streptomyces phage Gilson]
MIIGLAGYARSGKDSAADALESIGFRRIAFADKLREFMYEMNPPLNCNGMIANLRDVIDRYGWNGYKDTIWAQDIRRWMQVVGTNCVRGILGNEIWADATFNSMHMNRNYVVTDVRFVNEANGIRQRGGRMYRIVREGVGPANNHVSETALDNYDYDGFIHNDGSLEEFHDSVRRRILEGRI